MKMKKSLLILWATGALFAAGAAHAGPPVTITFKNLGTSDAKYSAVTSNEVSTNANASPKPEVSVPAKESDKYYVQNPISDDANAATVRYTIGKKTCVFATTFVNTVIPGGLITGTVTKVPKWNKSATASGGATCTATITSTNLSTYTWAVEFTMK
ncbi:hypothetical protein [Musicola paradisiaca]|uniref:Uncharacterized protein n=1 Tax=Musicola paradisiaca (strain Ech703) TaxID=579405 RepID=C6C775_MUSP7|nr:hypothetical protein [Musicola paradisiaca]ACS87782.1 conserved hypothetical protein [Musicola paradisiaca Ech703]